MTWTADELNRLDRAQELKVAGRRNNGTLRRGVTIWAVVVDGNLYLRSVRGADGAWYQGVQRHHEGRIRGLGRRGPVHRLAGRRPDPGPH